MKAATVMKMERTPGAIKSALLLLSLGHEQCSEILKLLSDDQVRQITETIASLGEVTPDQTELVLEEFIRVSGHGAGAPTGGLVRARRILASAFGQEVAKRMIERLPRRSQRNVSDLSSLEEADPQRLANFLVSEHPQTIALVLAHLKAEKSSKVIEILPEEMRSEAILRLASLDSASPEVVGRIAGVLDQKLKALGRSNRREVGGSRTAADVLNRLDRGAAEIILTQLESRDESIAKRIRNLLFVFEDLLSVDVKGIKELVGKADRKVLTVALKGTSDELQNHIFSTLSKRGAEMMREDMEALGPVKIREVEGAQQQIIDLARNLEKEGALSLSGSETEDYVV